MRIFPTPSGLDDALPWMAVGALVFVVVLWAAGMITILDHHVDAEPVAPVCTREDEGLTQPNGPDGPVYIVRCINGEHLILTTLSKVGITTVVLK